MLFATMTLTLAVSEITQYVTYSTSRVLFLSHGEKSTREQDAINKYRSLITDTPFSVFFKDSLFQIDRPENMGMGLNIQDFAPFLANNEPNLFYGVWTKFNPKVLSVDSLWGSTKENDPNWFQTTIGSYLGQESTKKDCENFNEKRWQWIEQIHSNSNDLNINYNNSGSNSGDNRC